MDQETEQNLPAMEAQKKRAVKKPGRNPKPPEGQAAAEQVRRIFRSASPTAAQAIVEMASDPGQTDNMRLKAAQYIVEYVIGRPPQSVPIAGTEDGNSAALALSKAVADIGR